MPAWKLWVLASRPKTLTAAFAPVAVGTAVAAWHGGFRALPAFMAMVGAFLIQIGTNFANDYYDFKKGADTEERLGPTRVTQAGLIAPDQVKRAMIATFALAVVSGVYLVTIGGWPILVIGLLSVACGIAYTGGPYPLGYNGLGDVFVFVFFGIVAVVGTTYVQTLTWEPLALVASLPIGALCTNILVVNNLRDADTDVKAGKRTVAVRFGKGFVRAEYIVMLGLAVASTVVLCLWTQSPTPGIPLLTLPIAVRLTKSVFRDSGRVLNTTLENTAKLLAIFGVLSAVGIALAPLVSWS